ncbi:MAG TPA: glycosyltransferase [Candidatus Paceibacterota bacterium]
MRIIVNDAAAVSGGALTILKGFYNYIIDYDTDNEWIFIVSTNQIIENKKIKVVNFSKKKQGWIKRLKFDFLTGGQFINSLKPDIVLSLQNTITYGVKAPQVVYMHQPIPFQDVKNFSFIKRSEYKYAIYQYIIGFLIKKSLRNADAIIVQTEWIRKAVIKKTGISGENVYKVFPNIPSYSNFVRVGKFDRKKYFYPASKYIYKNHKCIYDASSILRKKGCFDFTIELTIDEDIYRENIMFIGDIPFLDVINKYNESTLIFPSFIETVGLPLAEAREIGTIILASDCSFSREILNGYANAYFFNPFKPNELALLIEKILCGFIVKQDVFKNSELKNNSWDEVVNILYKTLEQHL